MEPLQIIAPNLNGVVYRNHICEKNILNTFLDFIDINKDGEMLLGSSNLNGRFWDGSLCYYKNYKTKSLSGDITANISLTTGLTDGKFLKNSKKIIISEDSGDLKILTVTELGLHIIDKYNNSNHEDRITEISLWSNGNDFVTGCADGSINTWEITNTNLVSANEYEEAHKNVVSSVSANPNDANLFVSTSYDRTAMLWDKREEKTGKVIYENEFCALTKTKWHPSKSNILVVSNSAGDIYLLDTREPEKFLSKSSAFQRSIHNLTFNHDGLLGVCADDHPIKIFDSANEDLKLIYMDYRHSDFVRGLVWYEDNLISCGWDKQIYVHCP